MAEYEVFKKGEFIDCDKAIKVVSYAFSIDEEGNSLVSLRFSGDMIEEISSLRFVMTQIAANDEVIAEGEVICDKIVYFEDGTFSPKAMIPVFGDCEGISIKVKEVVAGRYRYDGNRDKTDFSPVDKQDKSKPKKRKKRAAESDKAATPITLIFSSLILSLAVAVIAVFGFQEYQNKTDTFVRDGIIYQFATGDRSTGEIKVAGTVTNLISKKELYIPEIIDGMRVTEIKDSAFRNNGAISKIEFEGNVKKVGSFAFSDCVNLKEIDFEGIEEVGENAFERCGIETVNSSTLKTVGSNAFSACYSLKNVELGADVVSLDQNAFSNCVALESFSVKKTRINVDSGIFRGSRIRDLYLSELPESLGNSNVKATISQLFSANNFSYYSDDSGYAKNITLKKADRIAEYLCAGIKGLEKFTINDIKEGTIGAGAFENCSSLTSVSL
ncbi:MAG: leucine-rich repeat domain-containing protein, partial [Clostridia bacterium]|nr:leucine-rich repeat domain-containing protein [Clostridia bacterium]